MTTPEGFIGYFRVSTQRQGRSGLGLQAQRQAVASFLEQRGGQLVREYVEVESGKKTNRPELQAALRACKRNHCTLVIAKLDRLARNVAFISNLMEAGVDFVAADLPEANKLTLHVMAAMAEYERDMISKRTREALQAARDRGVKLGGPNIRTVGVRGRETQKLKADEFAQNVLPIINELKSDGVGSLRKIADCLNRRGIPTARGGEWHANTVRMVLIRST